MAHSKDEPFPTTPSPKRRPFKTENTRPTQVMSAGPRLSSDLSLFGQSSPSQKGPLPQSVAVTTSQGYPRQQSTPTRQRSMPSVPSTAPIPFRRHSAFQGAAFTRPIPSRPIFGNRTGQSKQGVQKCLKNSASSGEIPILFKDLATQRKVNKRKLEEHPPNIKDLDLFNPGTSKRLTKSLSLTEPDPVDTVGSKDLSVSEEHTKGHEKAQGSRRIAREQTDIIEITHQSETTTRTSTPDKEPISAGGTQPDTLTYESANSTKLYAARGCIDGFSMDGQLRVGVRTPKHYTVRLHIFEPPLQQLLSILRPPGQPMCFELNKSCLAAEYQQFFPLVCGCFVRDSRLAKQIRRIVIMSDGATSIPNLNPMNSLAY